MKSGTKYGLQLRGPQAASAAKKTLPPPPKPSIFPQDDDDEDTVEQAIARQAAKNRALKEVELQHKAALEQDSTAFSYDEVYDDIKAKSAPSQIADPEQSKSKYITKLLDKAKARQQEQDIIYERKLLKEREREDHLYGDKDKFVTTAYKQKLAEQAKWIEEERIRELREQANEVTNKKDLSDFYQNLLSKNVAFGANKNKADRTTPQEMSPEKSAEAGRPPEDQELKKSSKHEDGQMPVQFDAEKSPLFNNDNGSSEKLVEPERTSLGAVRSEPEAGDSRQKAVKKDSATEGQAIQAAEHKPSQVDLSAAKERYLARKRMRTT